MTSRARLHGHHEANETPDPSAETTVQRYAVEDPRLELDHGTWVASATFTAYGTGESEEEARCSLEENVARAFEADRSWPAISAERAAQVEKIANFVEGCSGDAGDYAGLALLIRHAFGEKRRGLSYPS